MKTKNQKTNKMSLGRTVKTLGLMGLAALTVGSTGCAGRGHFNPKFASTEGARRLAKGDHNARKFLNSEASYQIKGETLYVNASDIEVLDQYGISIPQSMPYSSVGDPFTVKGYKDGKEEVLEQEVLVAPDGTFGVKGISVNALAHTRTSLEKALATGEILYDENDKAIGRSKSLSDLGYENVSVNYVNASEDQLNVPFAGAYGIRFSDGSSTRFAAGSDQSARQFTQIFGFGRDSERFGVSFPVDSKNPKIVDGKEISGVVIIGEFGKMAIDPSYDVPLAHNGDFMEYPAQNTIGDTMHVIRTMTGLTEDVISASETYRRAVNEYDLMRGPQEDWRAKKQ